MRSANNGMQRTAQGAAADAERYAARHMALRCKIVRNLLGALCFLFGACTNAKPAESRFLSCAAPLTLSP